MSRLRVVFARLTAPLLLVLLVQSAALSKGVTFEQYRSLSEEKRQKLIKRYVKEADGYWSVSVGNYLVHTDISGEKALATAVKMDEFLRHFTNLFKGSFRIKAKPELYVMKTKSTYLASVQQWSNGRMSAPAWSAGLFARIGKKIALFGCAEGGDKQLYNTLFHEGTHQLMYFYLGQSCDVWFNEGVATNFETWDVSLSTDRNISEEIWKSNRPMVLYAMLTGKNEVGGRILNVKVSGKPNLEQIMEITSKEWSAATNPTVNYAQAWGIVNFLISHGPTSQKFLSKLLLAYRSGKHLKKIVGKPLQKVMSSRDRDSMVEYWNKYIAEIIVPHYDFSVGIERYMKAGRKTEAGKLVDAGLQKFPENPELLYYRGFLSLREGKAEEAYKILKPLKKKYPHHPLLNRTLGEAALAAGNRTKAKLHLKAALAENSRDEEARRLLVEAKKSPPKKPAPEE